MKTKSKALLMGFCAVLLVAASVLGTMAYLTDSKQVVNTFTVGDVKIELDEAKIVDEYGAAATGSEAARVKGNTYKLVPGHNYAKDPTVTVLAGSEPSYVKMTVIFTKADELDAIFAPAGADMISIFNGYDAGNWIYKGNTKDTANNTRTYEFWYKETVDARNGNVVLDALFDSITVPGTLTNAQLAEIQGMTITVNAYAIQADNFADAADAWDAFE